MSEIRQGVGRPRADAVRSARVRAVGTAFLRWRPVIVAPVALAQGALLATAEVATAQRLALMIAVLVMLALFVTEARLVRRRVVTERWLMTSLALTAGALTIGVALSGGAASPLLVLVLAPLVIAFAAFGRRRATLLLVIAIVLGVTAAALVRAWGPLPEPAQSWMRLVAFAGTVALAWTGVAGLADAYAQAGELLEALRLEAIAEASTRLRKLTAASAQVAHELKNPLAAMKALMQLEARGDSERSAARMAVVLGELERMEALVRDYLAVTRPAEALAPAPFDAQALMQDVTLLLSARAEAAGVALTTRGEGVMVADRARLREALFNLVDNALRASPRGAEVAIAHERDGGMHLLKVSDRGPGLPPHVAAAFEAGDSAFVTTRADGSGLGLGIAAAAVSQHGGRLSFRAREGGGTVALIELPEHA